MILTDKQIITLYDKTCMPNGEKLYDFYGGDELTGLVCELRAVLNAGTDAAAVRIMERADWVNAPEDAVALRRAAGVKPDVAKSKQKATQPLALYAVTAPIEGVRTVLGEGRFLCVFRTRIEAEAFFVSGPFSRAERLKAGWKIVKFVAACSEKKVKR